MNLHLWFDRTVADFPFAAFIRSDVQWLFNRGHPQADGDGSDEKRQWQHLIISVSAPGELFALTPQQVCDHLLPQLRAALPAAREATLTSFPRGKGA